MSAKGGEVVNNLFTWILIIVYALNAVVFAYNDEPRLAGISVLFAICTVAIFWR